MSSMNFTLLPCKMSWKNPKLIKFLVIISVALLVVTVKLFGFVAQDQKAKEVGSSLDMTRINSRTLVNLLKKRKEFLKVVHLDLKGGPPKLSYLKKVVKVAYESGANALLIEYEDMFPFWGDLRNVSADNAYPLDELREFVEGVEALKMKVIPLVQTFGHLEYVLKLEEFKHLRELNSFPQEICPANKQAFHVLKELIRQVMHIHPNAKYLHLGCDEIRHLGACPVCSKISRKEIFSTHVSRIARHVKASYPGVTPLIWDDMMRRWTFIELSQSDLGSLVEPVIWAYGNNIFRVVPRYVWSIYLRTFPKIWAASAFKGGFGETEILPNLRRHLENNLCWMKILEGGSEVGGEVEISPDAFGGIFITGWSRYDHFAVLCELLPVGIPSMTLSLLSFGKHFANGLDYGLPVWLEILKCPVVILDPFQKDTLFRDTLGNCSFPGSKLYAAVSHLRSLKSRVKKMTNRIETSGWVSRYNIEKNFTNPWRVIKMFSQEGFAGELLIKEFASFKKNLIPVMSQYFDNYTVSEWEEQHVRPVEDTLKKIRNDFQNLILRDSWPKRPLG